MRLKTIYCLLALLLILPINVSGKKKPQKIVTDIIADSMKLVLPDSLTVSGGRDSLKTMTSDSTNGEVFYSDEYLDTVKLKRKFTINDYSMIGVQYGVSLSQVRFNPAKKQKMMMTPLNIGVLYTCYGKMFGYMPYFGFQTGLFYGQDGYEFKKDKETGEIIENVDGAIKATYTYLELPLMSHFHFDVWHLKFIINAGLYGAYRLDVERDGANLEPEYTNKFYDYDRRFDYGVKAGAGFALVFDPIEFHVTATYRASLGTLYKPDYHSEYYYRFAYPSDIIISAGLHIQLTKRTGKTKTMLRKEAKSIVYETNTDSQSTDR